MKWKATHILKLPGKAPGRVMLNSGSIYTKAEWEEHAIGLVFVRDTVYQTYDDGDGVVDTIEIRGATCKSIEDVEAGASITPLTASVERLTDIEVRHQGKPRKLVVRLLPGNVIELRPIGCRERRVVGLAEIWSYAAKAQARKLVRERKAARAARKKGS
jgi:hypothetical protein